MELVQQPPEVLKKVVLSDRKVAIKPHVAPSVAMINGEKAETCFGAPVESWSYFQISDEMYQMKLARKSSN